ncbi:acetate--CoA ligase family protein [Cupriavidus basilensis]
MQAALARADASLPFEGVLVARMVRGWGELMVGVRRDPVFGLVVLAGIGGTAVEIFRQMAFGPAPLSPERALAMLEQSRAAVLFARPSRQPCAAAGAGCRLAGAGIAVGRRARAPARYAGNQSFHRRRRRAGRGGCRDHLAAGWGTGVNEMA